MYIWKKDWYKELIEVQGTYLDSLEKVTILGADEGGAGIGGIHMQPDVEFTTNRTDFVQFVEAASACCPKGHNTLILGTDI